MNITQLRSLCDQIQSLLTADLFKDMQTDLNDLLNRQVEIDVSLLRQQGAPQGMIAGAVASEVLLTKAQSAIGQRQLTRNTADQCGLASTVGTDQPDHPARFEAKVDISQNRSAIAHNF